MCLWKAGWKAPVANILRKTASVSGAKYPVWLNTSNFSTFKTKKMIFVEWFVLFLIISIEKASETAFKPLFFNHEQ